MDKYFNVRIEFDKNKVDHIIQDVIKHNNKGYVCSVNANIVSVANQNENYLKVINSALINICDGSVMSRLMSFVYKKKLEPYVGADLFIKYITMKKYSFIFLGNTDEVLSGLKSELTLIDKRIEEMPFKALPFRKVEEFDYIEIAKYCNEFSPDIIWVSLGAPKQEEFMFRLLPHINRGVMFGFGAIFNFYSGNRSSKRAPEIYLKLRLEWLYRLLQEPLKTTRRLKNELVQMIKLAYKEMYRRRKQ